MFTSRIVFTDEASIERTCRPALARHRAPMPNSDIWVRGTHGTEGSKSRGTHGTEGSKRYQQGNLPVLACTCYQNRLAGRVYEYPSTVAICGDIPSVGEQDEPCAQSLHEAEVNDASRAWIAAADGIAEPSWTTEAEVCV